MNAPGRHNNRFDTLRLLAALLVLWSHCFPLAGRAQDEPLARLTGIDTLGGLGVAIFFVLSGYLITLSWERQPHLLYHFGFILLSELRFRVECGLALKDINYICIRFFVSYFHFIFL